MHGYSLVGVRRPLGLCVPVILIVCVAALLILVLLAAVGVITWLPFIHGPSSSDPTSSFINPINASYTFISSHVVTQSLLIPIANPGTGLTARVFPNQAFTNSSGGETRLTVSSFSFAQPGVVASVMMIGTLSIATTPSWIAFQCTGQWTTLQVWIDDTIVCSTYATPPTTVIPFFEGHTVVVVRAEYVGSSSFAVQWNVSGVFSTIDSSVLGTSVSSSEARRQEDRYLQRQSGWGTASDDFGLQFALFPHALGWTPQFHQLSTGTTINISTIETWQAQLPHAPSSQTLAYRVIPNTHSIGNTPVFYAQLTVQLLASGATFDVSATTDGIGGPLIVVITSSTSASDWSIIPKFTFLYQYGGSCSSSLTCSSPGMPDVSLYSTWTFDSTTRACVIASQAGYTFTRAQTILSANQYAVQNHYQSMYPSSLSTDVQAAVNLIGWNYLFVPDSGMVVLVVRSSYGSVDSMFEWDNYFVSLVLAWLDTPAMLNSFIAISKATILWSDGSYFIPNTFRNGHSDSYPGSTQPPVGARCLLDVVQKLGGRNNPDVVYLVESVLDNMYNVLQYYYLHRLQQNGTEDVYLMAYLGFPESGTDNSPIYNNTKPFRGNNVPMLMWDMSLSSLFVTECTALAAVLKLMGYGDSLSLYIDVLEFRAQVMAESIQKYLWDVDIYRAFYLDTDSFRYDRISVMSFWPMAAGIPSVQQAETMMTNYLQSPQQFCLADDMDNNNGCIVKYGVPSVSIDSYQFELGQYWNNNNFPTASMILYWGLTHPKYASSAIVQSAKRQMVTATEKGWRLEYDLYGHVGEAFNTITGYSCNADVTQQFILYPYHACSALFPFITIRDADPLQDWPEDAWMPHSS